MIVQASCRVTSTALTLTPAPATTPLFGGAVADAVEDCRTQTNNMGHNENKFGFTDADVFLKGDDVTTYGTPSLSQQGLADDGLHRVLLIQVTLFGYGQTTSDLYDLFAYVGQFGFLGHIDMDENAVNITGAETGFSVMFPASGALGVFVVAAIADTSRRRR